MIELINEKIINHLILINFIENNKKNKIKYAITIDLRDTKTKKVLIQEKK